MKLSEAMMLGAATCKMVPGDWNSCALGAAGNAVGIPQSTIGILNIMDDLRDRAAWISDYWPWLESKNSFGDRWMTIIYTRFDFSVCPGYETLEQLADYIRSIEPSCGECNRFACICCAKLPDRVVDCIEMEQKAVHPVPLVEGIEQ